MNCDRTKSLEELEKTKWAEPEFHSYLVETVHKSRKIPVCELTIENLRVLISQSVGLVFLMPLAIERLRERPLVEGDLYPGDLLCSVLKVNPDFWDQEQEMRNEVAQIGNQALRFLDSTPISNTIIREALEEGLEAFRNSGTSS